MISIDMNFDDIELKNIEKNDIFYIQKWFNFQQLFYNTEEKPLDLNEFYERFLEYYLSEGEFFFKILKDNKFIGILKGRVEYKNPNEVWISCLMIDKNYRSCGVGSKVIDNFMKYFNHNFDTNSFYCGVLRSNEDSLKFWKKIGFSIHRVAKEFYNIDEKYIDMIIMKKIYSNH